MVDSRSKLKSILEFLTKGEKKLTKAKEEGEKFFLVHATWVSNMAVFIKLLIECQDEEAIDSLFDLNNVCLLFFESEEEEERKDLLGCFPGVVNNFLLSRYKEAWKDPSEPSSEIFLTKVAREISDYVLVPEQIHKEILDLFSMTEEPIQRKSVMTDQELLIDVHLASVLFFNLD
jgi:hypothetical protein